MKKIMIALFPFCVFSMTDASAMAFNIPLYYSGPAATNTAPQPSTQAFTTWCNGTCFPTTQFNLTNARTTSNVGFAYVWGNNLTFSADGQTLCFSEFIQYNMKNRGGQPTGTIYTQSNSKCTFYSV